MKKILTILLCVLFGITGMKSQTPHRINKSYLNCFTPGVSTNIPGYNNNTFRNASTGFFANMVHKTPEPGQYLRILILYIRFPDDNLGGNTMNGFAVWPDPTMPRPLNPYTSDNKFIDSVEGDTAVYFMDRYRPYTISDYFCEMSLGQFDVIGDEYSVMLPHTSVEYREMGYNCGQINEEAIKLAHDQHNLDFSRYNNWSYSEAGWFWTPGGGDNYTDMIVTEYRKAPGYPEENWFLNVGVPASGISDLGLMNSFTFENTLTTSGSGVTCLSVMQNYSKMTQIILHEMSHRYFFNHFEIGLMTGVEHSCFAYSPYERKTIDYVTPITIQYPYSELTATYTLGDYVSTGDLIELTLPFGGEKYYIANHQKRSLYDGISRGGKNCWQINAAQQDPYCPDGKGLYIYHELSSLTMCNENKDVELVQADGKFNWYIDRMVPYFIPGYNFTIPLFERLDGNYMGKSEFHQVIDSVLSNMQEVNDNPCSDDPDDYFVTYDWLGDGKDAYNIGYNEILSPYSNPRTVSCEGLPSGVSIKLLNQDTVTGNITIKIYFDDNIALQELPPAKPMNLKVTKQIFEPTTGRFHPALTWDKNIEPDFLGVPLDHGHYNIYRGVLDVCNPDTAEPVFNFVGSVSSDSTSFIDIGMPLYPEGGGSVFCTNLFRNVYYKIEAVDLSSLASLRSDAATISGYSEQCDDSILVGIHNNQLPVKFAVFNYPNPFNPVTKIKYSLPVGSLVTLRIYNILGEEVSALVKNEYKPAGYYDVLFDGTNLPSGVYFYRIEAGMYVESKKMVLIK